MKTSLHDKISSLSLSGKLLLPWAFALLAAAFGLACFILILLGRVQEGSLAAGVFFLCVLLGYFPQLESVKALSVDVKMRKSLDRADEILERVKHVALVTSQHSLYSMAWSGRFGGSAMHDKPELINAIFAQMAELDISKLDRQAAARPLIDMAANDLARRYEQDLLNYGVKEKGLKAQSAEFLRLQAKLYLHRKDENLNSESLKGALESMLVSAEITVEPDHRKFAEEARRMVVLHHELATDFTYSAELASLLKG